MNYDSIAQQQKQSGQEELELSDRINLETARIQWSELERHFARGVVVVVAPNKDLIEVAKVFVNDDKGMVKDLRNTQALHIATIEDAKRWQPVDAILWAVVVAPWVLVQDRS